MNNDFYEILNSNMRSVEAALKDYMLAKNDNGLIKSMSYSLLSGGKRIRPFIVIEAYRLFCDDFDIRKALPFACALEMIHTYSLIHDDLPAMDNDDFRRGKPSCHKAFGEAYAILAGDALLNQAFTVLCDSATKGEKFALAAKLLSEYAGANGMIIGQVADIYHTENKTEISEAELLYIQENKTGKLLLAPVLIPSILADNRHFIRLEQFGKELGRLFQITDDILDVTGEFDTLGKSVGKDETAEKLTAVKLYGLVGAKLRADELLTRCLAILEAFDCDVAFLGDLARYVRDRNK